MTHNKNWIDVPMLVAFNITDRCNLSCSYCFETRSGAADPSKEQVYTILHELDELGVPEILLEGGEIFMVPFWKELLQDLKQFNFKTHVISNGTLINEKWAEEVAAANISIGISLDGPSAKSNQHRGKHVFEKALQAIGYLTSAGVMVYVNVTVTRANISSLDALAQLCVANGVYGIVLQQLHCSGCASASFYKDQHLTFEQIEQFALLYQQLKNSYPGLEFVESELLDIYGARERFDMACVSGEAYRPKRIFRCGAGRKFAVIQANLDVILCGILGSYPCGNLKERTFQDVWHNSQELASIRALSEQRVDGIEGCDECRFNPVCDGGCRGDMFNYCGDWMAPHLFCPHK